MKRVLVVTWLSLATAGCAQSRSALSKQDSPAPSPVAATPVPSVYDTINTPGNPAIVRTAIKDPDDPRWKGQAASSAATPSSGGRAAPPGQPYAQVAGPASAAPESGPMAAQVSPSLAPRDQPPQAPGSTMAPADPLAAAPVAAVTPLAAGPVEQPAPDSQPAASAEAVRAPAPTQPSLIEPEETTAGPPATGPIPAPPETATSGSMPPPSLNQMSVAAPASTSALAQPSPVAAPPRQAPRTVSDPLLGPNPDLMPPIPDVSELEKGQAPKSARPAPVTPATGPESALRPRGSDPVPAAPDVTSPTLPPLPDLSDRVAPVSGAEPSVAPAVVPAVEPAAAPAAGPAVIPLELAPAPSSSPAAPPASDPGQKSAGDSASLTVPASAGAVAAAVLPTLEPAPQAAGDIKVAAVQHVTQRPKSPLRDSDLVRTNADKTAKTEASTTKSKRPAEERRRVAVEAGRPIAKVGDEVITLHDLTLAVKERMSRIPELAAAYRDRSTRDQALEQIDMLRRATLDNLIDRSLLVQDAKRHMATKKDTKMLDRFIEEADRVFRENEILPLERKYHVDTEYQVKEKLAEEGRSITQMQQEFRQMFLAENYLHNRVGGKLAVELPDMLKYYNDHVNKHEFDRPALITWREIVVEPVRPKTSPDVPHDSTVLLTSEGTSIEAARREAEALLERLRRGEDFAALARKESDGPTGSRNKGGLMETSPGGYRLKAVNQALESLPIGRLSGVIEGPDGFHIVKVEKRRPAGPASFGRSPESHQTQARSRKICGRPNRGHRQAAEEHGHHLL